MTFIVDFDGTISFKDSVDALLEKHAHESWKDVEAQWINGEISSKECMQQQIELVSADKQKVHLLSEEIEIDPSFKKFIEDIRPKMDIIVVSDGLDYVIHRTFQKENILSLEVYANNLIFMEGDRLSIHFPYYDKGCPNGCGVCKCAIAKQRINPLYLIGDGKSDMCLAGKVDYVFAKGSLITYCKDNHISFSPVETFDDVLRTYLNKRF